MPIADEKDNILWCPYCSDKRPVYLHRGPKLLASLGKVFGRHYTLVADCKNCGTVWLCEPSGTGYIWDVYAYGRIQNLVPAKTPTGYSCPYCNESELPLAPLSPEVVKSLNERYAESHQPTVRCDEAFGHGLRCGNCDTIWLSRRDETKGWDTLQGRKLLDLVTGVGDRSWDLDRSLDLIGIWPLLTAD